MPCRKRSRRFRRSSKRKINTSSLVPMPNHALQRTHLAKSDRLVPWSQVEYQLGEIPNYWKLLTNIARAAAEVTLYQDPDENRHVLKFDQPRTAIALKTADSQISE